MNEPRISNPTSQRRRGAHLAFVAGLLLATSAVTATTASAVTPVPTTREDFRLPGTQPSTITDNLAVPSNCTPCHSNYGAPEKEPYRVWQGSMVAQAGRDPITYAAMAIANQDAPHSGDLCIRCHMAKGWLEGRSDPEDASATTAADREGVQCNVCHRMVDPAGHPGAPAEDAAILAALTEPVTTVGGAQMVIDPEDRLRGPFNVVADIGYDPHASSRQTIVSPYHTTSEMCGTCHNVRNPVFQRNMAGEYEIGDFDTPGDPALAFPEQQTYDEWAASAYATGRIFAPQFAGAGDGVEGDYTVSSCQDCHMPRVAGRAALGGTLRPNMPLHEMVGANTFTPSLITLHPVFGAEVDPDILAEGAARSLRMLRRSATVSASIDSGTLTVRVTNETGHKLPTGYPDGRRMWLHVRALDADDNVVFESGRYDLTEADLLGYEAEPLDPDYDPNLHVWETLQGISADVALATGQPQGHGFHLAVNNVREFDNRIPPRGFTNAGFAAVFASPIGRTYADGQYWDDVTYPVGTSAVRAEVVLYYQTTTKEYVEFLRDENITTADGDLLLDLWEAADKGAPVQMANVVVDTDTKTIAACRKNIDKLQSKYFKSWLSGWEKCYAAEAAGNDCDEAAVTTELDEAAADLRSRLGGAEDRRCEGEGLTPASVGLGSYCPVPCASIVLFDLDDAADCSICLSESVANAALDAAYGATPPSVPVAAGGGPPASCQKNLGTAATKLASTWAKTLMRCEASNAAGKNVPLLDCSTDPQGKIGKAKDKASGQVDGCTSFASLDGCADGAIDNAAAYQCIEDAIGEVVPAYPAVAYP